MPIKEAPMAIRILGCTYSLIKDPTCIKTAPTVMVMGKTTKVLEYVTVGSAARRYEVKYMFKLTQTGTIPIS